MGSDFKKTGAAVIHSVVFFGLPFCEIGPLLDSVSNLFCRVVLTRLDPMGQRINAPASYTSFIITMTPHEGGQQAKTNICERGSNFRNFKNNKF